MFRNVMREAALIGSVVASLVVISPILARSPEGSLFGRYATVSTEEARKQAVAVLTQTGKTGPTVDAAVAAIWKTHRSLADKVADTLALGNADAARVLAEARKADETAPIVVPAFLLDGKQNAFVRSNVGLAYARALAQRKVYEEALVVFRALKAEDVVDPAAYFFHRAVCEHGLMLKSDAILHVEHLLQDVPEAPQGYRNVGALMYFEMQTWQEKDLGWVARKMDNIQRRLALGRGGPQTQAMQREVLVQLEEMTLRKPTNPPCPHEDQPDDPRPGDPTDPREPRRDTDPSSPPEGRGDVEQKRLRETVANWGKLPEKDRERIREELRQRMSSRDRAMLEAYVREMQRSTARGKN